MVQEKFVCFNGDCDGGKRFTANAFSVKAKAESYPEGSREVRRLEAPVEDGVYTASIEL